MKPSDSTKLLLASGVLSTIYYLMLNIIVAAQWPEYDARSQTISELSAVGTPTRALWIWLSMPYSLLSIAFGYGVWISAGKNEILRLAGILLLTCSVLGLCWPLFPMHQRAAIATGVSGLTDVLHIGLGILTEIMFLLVIWITAPAFGKRFRMFSVASFLAVLAFAILTFAGARGIQTNLPTPMLGVWERLNIGVFLVWTNILAIILLRRKTLTEHFAVK